MREAVGPHGERSAAARRRAWPCLVLSLSAFACGNGTRLAGDGGDDATVPDADVEPEVVDATDAPEGADAGDDGVAEDGRPEGDGDAAGEDAEPDADGVETDADGESFGDADADGDADPLADTDGDTISDIDEGDADTDGDGVPDKNDLDSDEDGIPDADEAGDRDLATPPEDCDGDGMPNFRDRDSDNDCLRDGDETLVYGTDPCSADTDGDGISDLIEIAYGSSPLDGTDHWRGRGDYIFLVPYGLPPSPSDDVLVFSTSLQRADVYFLVDTSTSMAEELAAFRASIATTVIPGVLAAVPDVWFGLGRFSDYATAPYGNAGDVAFYPEEALASSTAGLIGAAGRLTVEDGGDEPDAAVVALHALASGHGWLLCPRMTPPDCAGGFGFPCFRLDAVHLVVLITDASFHSGPGGTDPYGTIDTGTCTAAAPTYDAARDALVANRVRVLGIETGGSGAARAQLEQVVRDTGAVDGGGAALVFDANADGTGLGSAVVDAVRRYAYEVPLRVELMLIDDPSDGADAVAEFVDHVEVDVSGHTLWDPMTATTRVCTSLAAEDGDGDTLDDRFPSVLPGTSVCFRIHLRQNDSVPPPPTGEAQVFRATLRVLGDRFTPLDERDVYFLVPPDCVEW